jgi:uncharacterized cofD-like protein
MTKKIKKKSLKKDKKIVCIGGGTGTSTVLLGLKKYPVKLSAVISMFDNGAGSTGKLREELGVLAPGDIRQCLIALANEKNLSNLFHFRFEQGALQGHNIGNLLIAAAEKTTGSFTQAVEKLSKILNVNGEVIPVTLNNSDLKTILKNGKKINNEDSIVNCSYLSKVGIKKLFLEPNAKANPKAIIAIKNADLIVIGPGKFYTSLIPNFLVKGITSAIRNSSAKKVFICNLMTQVGNTDSFRVEDFLATLEKYLGKDVIDYVIFNTGKLSPTSIKEVKKVFPKANFIQYNKNLLKKKNFIGADILNYNVRKLNPADTLVQKANQRTTVLHNSDKLAKIILSLI